MLANGKIDVEKSITSPSKVERLQPTNNARDEAKEYGKKVVTIFLMFLMLNSIITAVTVGGFELSQTSDPTNSPTYTLSAAAVSGENINPSHTSFFTTRHLCSKMDGDRFQDAYDVRLKSPFTMVIAGPTGSGKTQFIKRLIERSRTVSTEEPMEIIYWYGVWQEAFNSISNVTFHKGLIDVKAEIPTDGKAWWLIIDNLMEETVGKNGSNAIFSKLSHHINFSAIFVAQNLFNNGMHPTTLNAHYLVIMKNPRDSTQIQHLARQIYPTNPMFLAESYVDATKEPFSYLTLDLKQNTSDDARVLGNCESADFDAPVILFTHLNCNKYI